MIHTLSYLHAVGETPHTESLNFDIFYGYLQTTLSVHLYSRLVRTQW